jgi:hypothetical protein
MRKTEREEICRAYFKHIYFPIDGYEFHEIEKNFCLESLKHDAHLYNI